MALRHLIRSQLVGVASLAALFAVGCGSSGSTSSATLAPAATASADGAVAPTFVGAVEGTDAYIAIQSIDGGSLAYLCDGKKLWSYLQGTAAGDEIVATEPGGASLRASVDGTEARGTVTLADGSDHSFAAVAATGPAGFYTHAVEDGDTIKLGGWIRLADGQVRGKTVAVSHTEDGPPPEADVDAGPIPPTADPQPARVSLIRCAIAGINGSKALKAFKDNPTPANQAALTSAKAEVESACGTGAGGSTT